MREQKRREVIRAGLCTNYWKCKEPATKRGGMCPQCFSDYKKRQGELIRVPVKPVPAPAPAPQVAPTSESFPAVFAAKPVPLSPKSAWAQGAPKVVESPKPASPKLVTPIPKPATPKPLSPKSAWAQGAPVAKPKTPTSPKGTVFLLCPTIAPEIPEAVEAAQILVTKTM